MEMYTNSPEAARRIFVPFGAEATAIDVFAYRDGQEVFEFQAVTAEPGGYSVTLPLFLNQFDSRIEIKWSITYIEPANSEEYVVNKTVVVDVVTPILAREEILGVWDQADDVEIPRIEKAVRHVIQAYTGQEFGHFFGTEQVRSVGGTTLRLPRRLISIDMFDGKAVNKGQFLIEDEGHTLKFYQWGVPPVKADFHGLHMHTGGVIHNPNDVRFRTFGSRTYSISGEWGWEAVPEQVKEAAKLLVNDYACADSQYRDRYLTSMTAADWRIQFNSGAFIRTGNVRADQLLSEYVTTRGWGVL